MSYDLAVRGGTVVTGRGRRPADVLVNDGRIVGISSHGEGRATEEVDASGCFVLPGFVDTHVHLMDPGDPTREDFPTGTEAALRQGVTSIIEHTHAWPVTTVDRLHEKLDHLRGRSWVDYGLAAHAWTGQLDQVAQLWRAGVSFFKVFTCETHGVPATPADSMIDLFEVTSDLDAPCLVHCEDDLLTARNERRLKAEGRLDGMVISDWRSRDAEEVAAGTVGLLAAATGAAVTIAHASHAAVIEGVESLRSGRGARLLVETCPHYLLLREHEAQTHGSLRKFTPPARSRHDGDEATMWEHFNSGAIAHISSDHAPSTLEQKSEGDIWSCHFGLPGLDTTAPILIDAAIRGRTSLERVVAVYSEGPARAYGMLSKGGLTVGRDADISIIDPNPSRALSDDQVISRAGWSPFSGRELRGATVATIVRGRVLVREGSLVHGDLEGRFLAGAGVVP